jgi:hypothetical protein
MAAGISPTEEFVALFNNLKEAAGNSPERLAVFYNQSEAIRDALQALHSFLARSDLERRAFHGQKLVIARAEGFEAAWHEYEAKWRVRVNSPQQVLNELIGLELFEEPDPVRSAALREKLWKGAQIEPELSGNDGEPEGPDPEIDDTFDPLRHNGGLAIDRGIERIEIDAENPMDDYGGNAFRLFLGAYDYLTKTIGLNVHEVFRRWRQVPVVFMPAHVSNRYGASEKGSLINLLDDAVRAYVFGAPAASIAICRAALEMVLKRHYGHGQWENAKLGNLIFLASKQYDFIQKAHLKTLSKKANQILHNYGQIGRLSEEEDRTILRFLETVKFLIQRAPRP